MADIKLKIVSKDGVEVPINKGKIMDLSVLSESTTTPHTYHFGVLSDSGKISISDFDSALLNLIIDESFEPIGCFVDVIFNGKVLNRLVVSDADYNVNDNSISMNLSSNDGALKNRPVNRTFSGTSLYHGISDILGDIGFSTEQIDSALDKQIAFGNDNNIVSLKDGLLSIKTPNFYIPKTDSFLDALNYISEVSNISIKTDASSYVNIDSSRPVFFSAEKENILYIDNSSLISELNFSLIKKEKTQAVTVSESKFTGYSYSKGKDGDYYPISTDTFDVDFYNDNIVAIRGGQSKLESHPDYEFYVSPSGKYLIGKLSTSLSIDNLVYYYTYGYPYYRTIEEDQVGDIDDCSGFSDVSSFISFVDSDDTADRYAGVKYNYSGKYLLDSNSEFYFALHIDHWLTTINRIKFQYGVVSEYKIVESGVDEFSVGDGEEVLSITDNPIVDIDAVVDGTNSRLSEFLAKTILGDFKNGIMSGSVNVSCVDFYNSENNIIKSSADGEIISVGDIVSFKKINEMFGRDIYWRVYSSEFIYDGYPYCRISFFEVSIANPAGLFDSDGSMIYSWDELVSKGYITLSEDSSGKISIKEASVDKLDGYLNISSGIESIWYQAFLGPDTSEGESVLKGVYIPETVTSIGYNAFYANRQMVKAELPSSLFVKGQIGEGLFLNCSSLKDVKIPKRTKIIPEGLFEACSSLENISIPSSVVEIKSYAFSGCAMKKLTIPDGVEILGERCFAGNSYTSVFIPKSVTTITGAPFFGATWDYITTSSNLKIYCEVDSRPEGWDILWNQVNVSVNPSEGTETPIYHQDVYWGYSRAQYIEETENT